jgi:ribose transport system permease protein
MKALVRVRGRAGNSLILGVGLLILIGFYYHQQPLILSPFGLRTLANGGTPLALAAIGQLNVILTGGIDLSIGGIISLTNCIAASVFSSGPANLVATILLTLATGVFCGLINGMIVAKLRLQPIVVTLATSYVFQGISLYVRPSPGGSAPDGFAQTLTGSFGYLPLALVMLVLAVGVVWRCITRTRLGQGLYAVGDNESGAFLSGIPVNRVLLLAYGLSGLFAAITGLFLTAQTTSGDAAAGSVYTLGSIAAAVLGGAALSGGRGSAIGAVLAAFVLSILVGVLFAAGVSTFYQNVFQGGILLAVLMFGNLHVLRARSWLRFLAAS